MIIYSTDTECYTDLNGTAFPDSYSFLLCIMAGAAEIFGGILFLFVNPEHIFNRRDNLKNSVNLGTPWAARTNPVVPEIDCTCSSNEKLDGLGQKGCTAAKAQNIPTAKIGMANLALPNI